MKINDATGALSGLGSTPSAKCPLGGATQNAAMQSGDADEVRLSNLTANLGPRNLNSLAAEVSSGRYQVDAELVSASIIQYSLQLGGANAN